MPKPSKKLIEENFFNFKKNARDGVCWVIGCKNDLASNGGCLCSKHKQYRWRQTKKQSAAYCTLRDHAKARGIEFTITPDYWNGLTDGMAYFETKNDEVASIDRVDPIKGYVPGNLRVVAISINIAKGNRERHLPEHIQEMLRRQREQMRKENSDHLEDDDNCPF